MEKAQIEKMREIVIHSRGVQPGFPSASGIEYWHGNYYGVGDDSPYLFTLDRNFSIVNRFRIKDIPAEKNGRISKRTKPDFEAMAVTSWKGSDIAFIAGSGSKSPARESGFFIDMEKSIVSECSLGELYSSMKRAAAFSDEEELNIEGVAISAESVYFANRGNGGSNLFFILPKEMLFLYLTDSSATLPPVEMVRVQLPSLSSYEAGLSGLVYIEERDELAFTASVEATDNAYDDGEILGSFVGIVSESALSTRVTSSIDLTDQMVLLTEKGEPIITKVESIVVTEVSENSYRALLASDNDNGPSEFFDVTLRK